MELYLHNGTLVRLEQWETAIKSLKAVIEPESVDTPESLLFALQAAVKQRIPDGKIGVFFSGGVDSAFLALLLQKTKIDFTCYTVGFKMPDGQEPKDIVQAQDVAKDLGFTLVHKTFNEQETEKIIEETTKLLGEHANVVTVGVGAVVLAAARLAPNVKHFFGGLGSEELFAGYDRHKKNPSTEECWTGLLAMYERDLVRDTILAKKLGITLHTPFLDAQVITIAMAIPILMKINGDENKLVLRKIAEELGLGKHAWHKKRAAQYGSSVDRVMGKLAKKKGFDSKKAYLESLQKR